MKICLFDHVRKFTGDLVEHWEKSGHEVKVDRYFDPALVHWCDTAFFEFCDLSIQRASDPNDSMWDKTPQPRNKSIIVRAHDIDIWTGHHNSVQFDFVNHLVFVAKHMQDKMLSEIKIPRETEVHLIKHGIHIDRFTFRERPLDKKIAWVCNCNEAKNLPLALQVIAANSDYSLHILGDELDSWKKAYVLDFIARNNLNVYLTERVDDVNQFLEDKDFLLLTSMKEAFSFVVGESMSKGIKPLIHHFYGAENVWDEKYLWNKVSEVRPMLEGEYNSQEYRQYIEANYALPRMLDEYDKIL